MGVSEEDQKKEESKSEECGVWGTQSLLKEPKSDGSKSWATKLFGSAVKANKALIAKENEKLVEVKKQERLHQIKVDSILPPSMISAATSRASFVRSIVSPIGINQYETSP